MANSEQRKNQIKAHLASSTDVNVFKQSVEGSEADLDQRKRRVEDHVRRTAQEDLIGTSNPNLFRQFVSSPETGSDQRKQRIKDHIRRTLG